MDSDSQASDSDSDFDAFVQEYNNLPTNHEASGVTDLENDFNTLEADVIGSDDQESDDGDWYVFLILFSHRHRRRTTHIRISRFVL